MPGTINVLQHHSDIHPNPFPASPSYSPEDFFDVPNMLELMASLLWIKPFFTVAWWLNLQNANHTYLKLTKFCGGNF